MHSAPNHTKTVAVGMSGGVDSSVAALLLKQQGYRVIGLFMKNWEEKDENGVCTSAQDFEDVQKVGAKLGIPVYAIEFVKEYWDNVFTHFLKEYQAGNTPNPDILCNREIKFNVFFKKAMELGADYLATGHYAQTHLALDGSVELVKGLDPGKDQTYFIYTLQQDVLRKVLFPIGHLLKSEVRELARVHGLSTHAKKDSTGICFIGERNFRNFLNQYVKSQKGFFKLLDGTIVGEHLGVPFYTLGQRKGLGLGGQGERWFVVAKDTQTNTVYVERGDDHPALYADELWATELSWVAGNLALAQCTNSGVLHCSAKIRYRQHEEECTIHFESGSSVRVHVRFKNPQRAITPRQSIVFYQGDRCLGGGIIERAGPSHFEKQNRISFHSAPELSPSL